MLASGEHFDIKLDREEMDKLALWIDLLVPYAGDYTEAMNPEVLPRYLHFVQKRQRWQAEEAGNIQSLIKHLEADAAAEHTEVRTPAPSNGGR
jgi:poly(3-hydroxybutyrate) depolymerase